MTIQDIPALNAALNATCCVLLMIGFILIKSGKRKAHGICMAAAFVVSAIFLIGYVTHKILVRGVHTPFLGEGLIRPVYYVMLITHILLAIANLPMILLTMRAAIKGDFELHRKRARITWPVWMYVSVTGVLVYFMLYRWYPAVPAA